MLRSRSRTVTTKQSLMADHNSVPSSKPKQTTPIPSFFGSPRFFNGFFPKGVTNFEPVTKPTYIFESPRISSFGTPFGYYDQNMVKSSPRALAQENKQFSENTRIGLALINDETSPDHNLNFTKPNSCTRVQLSSKLKIHIPTLSTQSSQFSDELLTPSSGMSSGVEAKEESPNYISTACLSWSEMELSEDYTCVITHGPSPKTTRIFDNCIVESCCGVVATSDLKTEYNNLSSPSQSFLSYCHTCNKSLGQGNDIYMYRGEKAFCSNECRCEEIFLDEMNNT